MSDRHRQTRRHHHGPPPWWPEGEAWPPADGQKAEEARHMRGNFMWRIGCAFLFMVVLVIGLFALLSWLIGTVVGSTGAFVPVLLIGLFVLLVLALAAARFAVQQPRSAI